MSITELSLEQKRSFYRNGFIVLKNLVPKELTSEAKRLVYSVAGRKGGFYGHYREVSENNALTDLVNKSALGDVLRNTMGPFDRPSRGFAAILFPTPKVTADSPYGVPYNEIPNYGWSPHLDGLWAGRVPQTPAEVDDWNFPKTEQFGKADATELGANHTPLFQDPEMTLSIGSFTAFVGVALNDQTKFGRGNLGLLKGAHHAVQKFFQRQRDSGGVVGPGGEGWPRLQVHGNSRVGLNYLPEEIRDQFEDDAEHTPDGSMWLKPTPVLMNEGDAVIVLHAVPHSSSRNDGTEPRMNIYFRIRRERPGGAKVLGDSDHPDRGWDGEFLDYEEGYNPWKVAIEKLCDHWSEWDGMQDVVEQERARSNAS